MAATCCPWLLVTAACPEVQLLPQAGPALHLRDSSTWSKGLAPPEHTDMALLPEEPGVTPELRSGQSFLVGGIGLLLTWLPRA